MGHKLFILVLFIGGNVPHKSCMSEKPRDGISSVSPKMETFHAKFVENTTFYLINPKQTDDAERVMERFLLKLVSPIPKDLSLRIRHSGSSKNPDKLAQAAGTAIRRKFMEFAEQCGLEETSKHYKVSLSRSINESAGHWYSEAILQGSLLLSGILRMVDEGSSLINQYVYHGNDSGIAALNFTVSAKDSIEIPLFGRINNLMDYVSRLPKCVNATNEFPATKNRKTFIKLLRNMTADSPEKTVPKLKMHLRQSKFPKSTNSQDERFRAIFCSFAVQQGIMEYGECADEFNRIKECIFKAEDRQNLAATHRLTVAPWLQAIKSLGHCKSTFIKDRKRVVIYCHLNIPLSLLSTKQKLRFIYDTLKLENVRARWMRHVANDLGDALSRSQIGNEIINELYRFCRIFQDGRNKINRLATQAIKNKRYYAKHRKILNAFKEYKRGLLAKTILSIRRAHDSMYALNDFMAHIDPMLYSNWESYMGVLRSIADWVDCLLVLVGITDSDDADVIEFNPETTPHPANQLTESKSPEYEENEAGNGYDIDNGFGPLNRTANAVDAVDAERNKNSRKAADVAFGKLLRTMRDASNAPVVNTKSTLTSIANNILLATMFVETVGLVTTLFSYQSIATENGGIPIAEPIEADSEDNDDDMGFDDYDL